MLELRKSPDKTSENFSGTVGKSSGERCIRAKSIQLPYNAKTFIKLEGRGISAKLWKNDSGRSLGQKGAAVERKVIYSKGG